MYQKHTLFVDGNSVGNGANNGPTLNVGGPDGMPTQAIYGFLRMLRAQLTKMPAGTRPIVAWDGRAQFRFDLYPDYKANRADDKVDPEVLLKKEQFKRQRPIIHKALELLGVTQLTSPLLEADDLGAHFVPGMASPTHHVTMFSGDKDWIWMVGEHSRWLDPMHDRDCTHANFLEMTGYFDRASFGQAKALTGDDSDNVPGIFKLGPKTAQELVAKWKTIQAFWDAVDAGAHTPATRKSKTAVSKHPEELLASPEGRALVRRNLLLLDLSNARKPAPGELVVNKGKPNPDGFALLCERLAFASILKTMPAFLHTFNLQPAAVAA